MLNKVLGSLYPFCLYFSALAPALTTFWLTGYTVVGIGFIILESTLPIGRFVPTAVELPTAGLKAVFEAIEAVSAIVGWPTGKVGLKGVTKFFTEILKLRWLIEPGDVLYCDCTSSKPEQQFKVGHRFVKNHPVWTIDYDKKVFFWHRPPYSNDPIWEDHEIIGIIPANPLQNTENNLYFDCFSAFPKDPHTARSKDQN